MYAQKATDNTLLPDCSPEYDASSDVYHMRITVNKTSHKQISPSSPCGILFVSHIKLVRLKNDMNYHRKCTIINPHQNDLFLNNQYNINEL